MARRTDGGSTPTTTDPIDIALAAEADAAGAAPAGVARRLLVNQNRLVKTQILSERAGLALKLLTGLAGLIVAAALAVVVWDAANTRSLVVEPFSVPADMAGRGMTGQVVATRLLDELNRLQTQTLSYRAEESYGNWKNDIKVEIPQTGVSIGELQAFLRQWLGEETRISGEVVRTAAGVAVTARAGAVPGHTFTGPEEQLDALIAKSALTVYGATQPERFAAWLSRRGDTRRAETIYTQITITGSRRQRAWAHAMLAQGAREPAAAQEHARQAVELDPELPPARLAVASAAAMRGDIEGRIEAGREAAALLRGPRAREMAAWAAVFHRKEQEAAVAAYTGDLSKALRLNLDAAQPAPDQPAVACRNCGGGALLAAADAAAGLHDRAEARRLLDRAVTTLGEPYRDLLSRWIMGSAAAADQDWPAFVDLVGHPAFRGTIRQMYPPTAVAVSFDAPLAMAYAAMGRPDQAEPLLAGCPAEGVPCLQARAMIAAARADHRTADALFARAVERAPSSPHAAAAWAEAKIARGDVDGGLALVRDAHRRSPRWADLLKIEGDALMARRDYGGAARAYARAAERAPTWGGLHLQWARALRAQGKTDEAAAMERGARAMSLSRAEKSALGVN